MCCHRKNRILTSKIAIVLFMIWCATNARIASAEHNLRIGYLDYADQWTKTEGVHSLLKAAGVEGENLTAQLRGATLKLEQFDCLIAGSFFTNDPTLRNNFSESRIELRSFVDRGGTIVIFTQADQDSKQEGWMPLSFVAARGDLDYASPLVMQPQHPLFNVPNQLREGDFADWNILQWHAAWETFEEVQNFAILAAQDKQESHPCILEGGWGKGRVLLFAIAPDKAYVLGNEKSKKVAELLIQNILAYCENVKEGKSPAVKVSVPRLSSYYTFAITGSVFDDKNGNGTRDVNEPALPRVAVTDGAEIVFTDAAGHYEIKNPLHQAKLVYVLQPAGFRKTSRFYYFLVGKQEKSPFDFALQRSRMPETSRFRFVQTTDIHINGDEDVERFKSGLAEIAHLSPTPDFIIATGDLVNNGNYRHQFEAYCKGIASSAVTHFNVFGNHDRCDGQDRMLRYNEYLGPDYYSFDHGDYHFLVINNIEPSDTQKRWVEKDVSLLGAGKTIFAFVHYPHKLKDLDWLKSLGVTALFGGHWHTSKIVDFGPMRCYATPTFVMGAIDNSPAGFFIVDVDGNRLKTNYRFGGQKKNLTIVYPSDGFAIPPNGLNAVIANIYDTSSLVTEARFKMVGPNGSVEEGSLQPEGEFTWRAPFPAKTRDVGTYRVEITAQNDRNATWSALQEFTIRRVESVSPQVGSAWRMFAGTPQRDGLPSARVGPPFTLAWSTFTGGSIDFSSPILSGGTLYIGVRDRNALEHNGVIAMNALTGATQWFFKTDNAVNHSPACDGNKVYATDVGGRVYALDAARGTEAWHYDLGTSVTRWIFSAPAIDGDVLYAGSSPYLAALDCRTGSLLWKNQDGQDWITSYASPAVGDNAVVMGGMWTSIAGKESSLYAVDNANGKVLWADEVLGMHGSPVIHKNAVFYNDTKGKFSVADVKTGNTLWSYQMDPAWSTVTPAISEPLVITGSGAGTLYALDLNSHLPMWEFKVGKSDFLMSPYDKQHDSLLSSPVIAGDIVYVGASNGTLYALEKTSGKELWSHEFGAPIVSTPLVSGNELFVATYDGHIYALTSLPSDRSEDVH